jgi:hypothetical protein
MRWIFSVLVVLFVSAPAAAQSVGAPSRPVAIPTYATQVFRPCKDQPRTRKALTAAFEHGRTPSVNELRGSWVAIGSRNEDAARPDLDCAGLVRGASGVFESVIVPDRDSVEVDMIGMALYRIPLAYDAHGNLLLPIEEGEDDPVDLKCRLTRRRTLTCVTETAGRFVFGTEYARMPVKGSQRMNRHVDVP